ncbi:MAG: alpha/beta hydrolase [Gammaproteobacteria bacterium]|nr:MAG: alpha/beta hydrolase [Gammaproteobacteria bacterium]
MHTTPFKPPVLLRNGHLQSVLNGSRLRNKLVRERIQFVKNTESIHLIDCDQDTRLIGALNRAPNNRPIKNFGTQPMNRGLVVLLHGWEGSFESIYMMTATSALLNAGFDVFRLNLRDHGPTLHLNKELFNATLTQEITNAISVIKNLCSPTACFLAGYSLGGNFALRIAADSGTELDLTATMGICSPINPARTMAILEKPRSIYHTYFFNKWRASLQSKLAYFPDLNYGALLKQCKNLADINRFFIPGHTPCSNPEEYFGAYSLTSDRLAELRVPALLLTSRDDPIIPAVDLAAIKIPPPLQVELVDYGGHCGFLENYRLESWAEQRMVSYFLGQLTQ